MGLLHSYVGGRWASAGAGAVVTDLGTVAVRDAVDFLVDLARRDDGRTGEATILPAAFADSVPVWPALLRLARDDRVARRARR